MEEMNQVDVDVKVEGWKIRYILGQNSEHAKGLERDKNVKIRVVGDNDQKVLRISGIFSSAQAAKERVEEMSSEIISTKININQEDVGRIIGQSGRKIQALREESGASMKVVTEGQTNVVVMTGFRENVESAQKAVEGIVASKTTTEVVISNKIAKELLKDSGREIKNLQTATRTRLWVKDDVKSTNTLVEITGSKKYVEDAMKKLKKMSIVREDREKDSISLSNAENQALQGSVIQEIQNKTGTKAFFFGRGPYQHLLVFSGEEHQIDKAKREVQKVLDQLSHEKLVWVPHASLGKYQNILTELEVTAEASEERGRGEQKFQVPLKVTGSKSNVDKAIKKLKDICKEKTCEPEDIDKRLKERL